MKKLTKQFFPILLCVTLCLSLLVSVASAMDLDLCQSDQSNTPSELFVEVATKFFTEQDSCKAIDKSGNDISSLFYSTNIVNFQEGRFENIREAFLQELSMFSWDSTSATPSPYLVLDRSASQNFYVLGKTVNNAPGTTFEMAYSISGTYRVYDDNHTIMSASDASLDILSFNAGRLYTYALQNVSTHSSISADKQTVTFSASFKVDFSLTMLAIPGQIIWTERMGPYSQSVVGRI